MASSVFASSSTEAGVCFLLAIDPVTLSVDFLFPFPFPLALVMAGLGLDFGGGGASGSCVRRLRVLLKAGVTGVYNFRFFETGND